MQNKPTLPKIYIFSLFVIFIPFLEFYYSNTQNIDLQIFYQTLTYFTLTLIFIYSIYFIVLKINNNSPYNYMIFISISYWLLFRFNSIKNFFGGDNFALSSEISFIIFIFLFLFLFLFVRNKNFFKRYYIFVFIFIIFQNIFLLFFISLNYFKLTNLNIIGNSNYIQFQAHNNKSKNYFSKDEIEMIKKNKNKNIYYFIFDGMTSLDMYQKFGDISTEQITKIKNKFQKNNYIYIDNSFSNYAFTGTTFGSMMQMQPLFKKNLTKYNQTYKDQLYPKNLSKYNFENNKLPNLIHNLKKIDYKFIWLGMDIGCKFYNPKVCIDYIPSKKKADIKINKYVLESFLKNTPIILVKNLLFGRFIQNKSIVSSNANDFTNEFINKYKLPRNKDNKNYFYLVHNLFPKGLYIFKKNCDLKTYNNKSHIFSLDGYIDNYSCALKKIEELIIFLEKNDPEAIVIIQADHGIVYDGITYEDTRQMDADRYKIFNMVKVPGKCKEMTKNSLDTINSVRLAISCATNTNIKILDSGILKGL